jgi:hypothetical protein
MKTEGAKDKGKKVFNPKIKDKSVNSATPYVK